MGVYIKGLDMPKNCDECWKKFHGFGWVEHDEEWGTFYCKACKGFCSDPRTKCPLIPVHDHGRLIDADELIDYCKHFAAMYKESTLRTDKAMRDELLAVIGEIINMPTIIPEDKEGT